MLRSLPRIVALTFALAGVVPTAASATDRYMSPNGATSGSCAQNAPCKYTYVVNGAGSQAGDTVYVTQGTYDVSSAPMVVSHRLSIVRAPSLGALGPKIRSTTGAPAVVVNAGASGTAIRALRVDAPSDIGGVGLSLHDSTTLDHVGVSCGYICVTNDAGQVTIRDSNVALEGKLHTALLLYSGGRIQHTDVTVKGGATAIVLWGGGSSIEDSTIDTDGSIGQLSGAGGTEPTVMDRVSARGADGLGTTGHTIVRNSLLVATGPDGVGMTAAWGHQDVRNVTAIGLGANGIGLRSGVYNSPSTATVVARNVVARGTAVDVSGTPAGGGAGCPCPPSQLDISSSAFASAGPQIADHGRNVYGPTAFVDVIGGDFRLAPGAPAIDAGETDDLIGSTDLAGHPRAQGAAPDLGAYESTPDPTPTGAGGSNGTPTGSTPAGSGPSSPGSLGPQGDHTAPVIRAVTISRQRRLRYTVSEAATVRIVVSRRVRRRGRATRVVRLGVLTRSARSGRNGLTLPRRIGRRSLSPGLYVLTLTATDHAGNHSRAISRGLRST